MEELSKEKFKDLLKSMGLGALICDDKIINLYAALKIEPQFSADGTRLLTPYEILGVAPRFDKNGNELPIFIFLKSRKVKKSTFTKKLPGFIFVPGKVQKKNVVLKDLKRRYHSAMLEGDMEKALEIFEMVNALTGDAERELGYICQYLKFYKRMKRQILIDLFAHFLMLLLNETPKNVKMGVVQKEKKFWPFKEKQAVKKKEIINIAKSFGIDFGGVVNDISSIKIEQKFEDDSETINVDIERNKIEPIPVENKSKEQHISVPQPIRKSFINRKIIQKLRIKRKNKRNKNIVSSKNYENF